MSFKGTHSKRPSRVRQACVCMSAAEYVQLSQRAHSSEASWQSRRRSQKLSTGTHSKRPSRGVAHCAELPEHLKSLLPAQQEQLLYLSRKYLWGILFFTHGYQSAKLEGTSNKHVLVWKTPWLQLNHPPQNNVFTSMNTTCFNATNKILTEQYNINPPDISIRLTNRDH